MLMLDTTTARYLYGSLLGTHQYPNHSIHHLRPNEKFWINETEGLLSGYFIILNVIIDSRIQCKACI